MAEVKLDMSEYEELKKLASEGRAAIYDLKQHKEELKLVDEKHRRNIAEMELKYLDHIRSLTLETSEAVKAKEHLEAIFSDRMKTLEDGYATKHKNLDSEIATKVARRLEEVKAEAILQLREEFRQNLPYETKLFVDGLNKERESAIMDLDKLKQKHSNLNNELADVKAKLEAERGVRDKLRKRNESLEEDIKKAYELVDTFNEYTEILNKIRFLLRDGYGLWGRGGLLQQIMKLINS